MSSTTYTITEARARLSELLRRAKAGEEIVITKGHEPQARILPPAVSGRREAAPLRHLHLPDDLFDRDKTEPASQGTPRGHPSETTPMSTVLDDVTSESIDAVHIQRRVDDWGERLKGLYTAIGEWLPDGWAARQGAPVTMHEKLMRKHGVAAMLVPTLELVGPAGEVVRLEPRALWAIGGNGRVDLRRDGQHYLIVDMAESFEQPNWQVANAERRDDRETVTRDWLRRILQ